MISDTLNQRNYNTLDTPILGKGVKHSGEAEEWHSRIAQNTPMHFTLPTNTSAQKNQYIYNLCTTPQQYKGVKHSGNAEEWKHTQTQKALEHFILYTNKSKKVQSLQVDILDIKGVIYQDYG